MLIKDLGSLCLPYSAHGFDFIPRLYTVAPWRSSFLLCSNTKAAVRPDLISSHHTIKETLLSLEFLVILFTGSKYGQVSHPWINHSGHRDNLNPGPRVRWLLKFNGWETRKINSQREIRELWSKKKEGINDQ